ncbi:alcohol dehydrogenase catalytic domain-containing protein [Streptomyces sp. NPDC001056]
MSDTAVTMVVTEPCGPVHPATAGPASPPARWVRVSVAASGVCHADIGTAAATGKGIAFPVTPGHEVAGVIAETGDEVVGWAVGDRVAVGWFGGSCGHCAYCRVGDVVHCPERRIPGLSYPGGWAQSITVPADALARVPDGLDLFDAAPFGCAGVTTFNAVRKAGIRAGGRVAVFGIGGLGHLAVQFATKLGYETVAIARGADREPLALDLGARHYMLVTSLALGVAARTDCAARAPAARAPSASPLEKVSIPLTCPGARAQLTAPA